MASVNTWIEVFKFVLWRIAPCQANHSVSSLYWGSSYDYSTSEVTWFYWQSKYSHFTTTASVCPQLPDHFEYKTFPPHIFINSSPWSTVRPLLLFSLFLVARARSFFWKYKKKKLPSKSTKLLPARARSSSPLLASCMTRRLKTQSRRESRESHFQVVAWTTKIVKGSFFKLQSSWGRSIKTEKDGLRDPLVCVGIFQAVDVRVNARSSTKAGPIDGHSDFAPFAASSANTRESMEMELAIKWSCQQGFFFAARVLGKLSSLKALQRRETRRGRGKRHMHSVEWVLLRRSVRRHCKENVLSKRAQTFTKNRKIFEGTGSCTTTLSTCWAVIRLAFDWWTRDECRLLNQGRS